MKVKDIMSNKIATIKADDTIETAAKLMQQHNIGSLPVCNQQQVVGIVTDRDITVRSTAIGQSASSQKVSDIMTTNPVLGTPDMDVHDAVRIMSERQVRRLPIVENNNLVGIVALGDISIEPALQDNAEYALKNISRDNSWS